jgi:V/A-type H+/Na+-transporting ATPase subunit K
MMDKRLAKVLSVGVFLTVLVLPAIAFAQEATAAAGAAPAWQFGAAKALAAGFAMALSALSAAYAQAKIGSAAAGTLAERPEVAIWVITLQALPEVIVLLGFVSAIMINSAKLA